MFAKLKKKVIEENGGRGKEGVPDKSTASPGATVPVHSPLSKEPPGGGLKAAYSIERLNTSANAATNDNSLSKETSATKEDLVAMLTKRTEQCKKMEGNISDLAALIKDKNRTLEQMESQIKQHEEVLNKRLAEQKAEFDAYRDKLIAGYQDDKLAMEKEKQELNEKLRSADEYREKYFKWEADSEEIQDFTVQELAKVKHMLLLAQSELESLRKELDEKSQLLITCQARERQLEADFTQSKNTTDMLEKECERLKEDNKERAELVTSLSKDKSAFQQRLDELNKELTEKQNKIGDLNHQLSELDNSYRALEHSSETHRNKMSKLLEEKQEHIDMLEERVVTLDQRLNDHSLSGDDRVTALQTEREGLEKKLSEARQQLTEIKSTWSDKISHLEAQISHLNTKIVEDSEELASNQKAADAMRDSFQKQIEDLRRQLEDAEKRALENYELSSSIQSKYEKQIKELEIEGRELRSAGSERESSLMARLETQDAELRELTAARTADTHHFKTQLEELQQETEAALSRETRQEQLCKAAETRCVELQNTLDSREEEVKTLQRQLEDHNHNSTGQDQKVQGLEEKVRDLTAELTTLRTDMISVRRQFNDSDQEKGELMVRNAQLSQQLTTHQQRLSQQQADLDAQITDKEQTIHSQGETIAELNDRITCLSNQVGELEALNKALGTTDHLESTIQTLQDQLADKNRTLKKQEQTVKDLRQTLQRELRVQALPNDDASDDNNASSPSISRKLLPPAPRQTVSSSTNSLSPSSTVLLTSSSSAVLPLSSSTSVTTSATAAVKPMTSSSVIQVSTDRGIIVRRDLENDVNFLYLKHVVLKFMLSRESEAVQLIKAVAVLLNFTSQEQQLIRQTLEWKMSWFGSKPSAGKGQKSKVIPPTY